MHYIVTIEYCSSKKGYLVYPFKSESDAANFVDNMFPEFQNYKYCSKLIPEYLIKEHYQYRFKREDYVIINTIDYSDIASSSDGELTMCVIKCLLPFIPEHFLKVREKWKMPIYENKFKTTFFNLAN